MEGLQLEAPAAVFDGLEDFYGKDPSDAPSVDSFTTGQRAGMPLTELIGVPLDDPRRDGFVDRLTVEELCHTLDPRRAPGKFPGRPPRHLLRASKPKDLYA